MSFLSLRYFNKRKYRAIKTFKREILCSGRSLCAKRKRRKTITESKRRRIFRRLHKRILRGNNMDNKTFGIASFAILIEAIITYFNQFFVQENFCWQMLFSIALGIVIAVAYKLDLPAHFNLNSQIPYVGCVLTGILLSRGSNYLFELLERLK